MPLVRPYGKNTHPKLMSVITRPNLHTGIASADLGATYLCLDNEALRKSGKFTVSVIVR